LHGNHRQAQEPCSCYSCGSFDLTPAIQDPAGRDQAGTHRREFRPHPGLRPPLLPLRALPRGADAERGKCRAGCFCITIIDCLLLYRKNMDYIENQREQKPVFLTMQLGRMILMMECNCSGLNENSPLPSGFPSLEREGTKG
jgi:hypothetical protein